MSGGITAAV